MKRCWHGVEMEERKMLDIMIYFLVVLSIIGMVKSLVSFVVGHITARRAEETESEPDGGKKDA